MTVYAATETEMGATTAKFSRLNGYYVVAETAQKAVDAVSRHLLHREPAMVPQVTEDARSAGVRLLEQRRQALAPLCAGVEGTR